jgi:hypothetical protein
MPPEDVFDNPTGWMARHIRRYVESDGEADLPVVIVEPA